MKHSNEIGSLQSSTSERKRLAEASKIWSLQRPGGVPNQYQQFATYPKKMGGVNHHEILMSGIFQREKKANSNNSGESSKNESP